VNDPFAFTLAVLVLLAVPGPTNTLLAGAGWTSGIARSLPLLLGELAGYNIAIAVYRNTLATMVPEGSGAQIALRLAIAAYLLFLAVRLWRTAPDANVSAFTLRRVFVTTVLNPKALILALLIFPAPPAAVAVYTFGFSALVVAVGTGWVVTGSLISQFTKTRYSLVAPRVCAVALAAFAVAVVSKF
jgi:threonine/homoserine/homoserine lactone efflux protein